MLNSFKSYFKFLMYIIVTIIVTYYMPASIAHIWYFMLLFFYWRSDDEPFWLAFFMTTVDGFAGFMGLYEVTLKLLPGLPGIELAQFYILLSAIKAYRKNVKPYLFYNNYLKVLFWYLIFLILWGQILGFKAEPRDYFRIAKLTLPFLLLYSLPRLLIDLHSYKRLFGFIFIILIAGIIAQLFTLFTGISPPIVLKLTTEQLVEAGGYETGYRGFYNPGAVLVGIFGALFFLSSRDTNSFNKIWFYFMILFAFGIVYLSATRGWILSFGFIIISTVLFVLGIKKKRTHIFLLFLALLLIIYSSDNKIKRQIDFANKRLKTLESITKGDITAEGTLKRLSERSPRVMKIWKESPVFGWGFSSVQRKYNDGHVGNQNLLMTSGIVGFMLLIGFLFYFDYKILKLYKKMPKVFAYKNSLLIFIIFLLGWFIIHSTSSQHFNYMVIPAQIIPQAIFLSFGSLIYSQSKKIKYGQSV